MPTCPLASLLLPRPRAGARNLFRTPAILVAAAACLAGSYASAHAQTVDPNLWVTNGPVYSVVREGGTIYIGGHFTQVGPATGGGVPLDATSGGLPASFPKVAGNVLAVTSDGAGGWFIGGAFTHVGGLLRSNLAHVAADLSVSAWSPNPNSWVHALAVSGSTVYVGGEFTAIGGQGRQFIAAIDAATGAATAWNPTPFDCASGVYALAVSGSTIYAGGPFCSIGGQPRNNIAAFDAATGSVTAWNPDANSTVYALAVSGSTVYAAGDFISIGGQARAHIAALDASTGAATPWDPSAGPDANAANVLALAVSGSTVYAAGGFGSIGGQARRGIAALDAATGAATAWNPNPNTGVLALAVGGSTVYVSGGFSSIGGQARPGIAALDAATGAATAWEPNPNGTIRALAVSGSRVYVGGDFTSINGQARTNIAALDAATGAATAWSPNANSFVYALAVSGSTVYAGGDFGLIGGQLRDRIAALDAATGTATAWDPNANDYVYALAVSGSTVYVGGFFSGIGGQARNNIAALDAATGTATAWNPYANSYVNKLAVSGSTVYVAGGFGSIGGQARHSIAALDAATGTATAWNPDPSNTNPIPSYIGTGIFALTVDGSTVYTGGAFTSIGGRPRANIAALDAATGTATDWNPGANFYVQALSVSGSTVYAGGSFTSIGGQARSYVAALDATTGTATAWDPSANNHVVALAVDGSTVYAGGGFRSIGGLPQSGIAALGDNTTATLLAQFVAASTEDGIELRWMFGDPSRVTTVGVERASHSAGPWLPITPELRHESDVTVALDRTVDATGDYFYRLVVQLTSGGPVVFGPVSASILEPITTSDVTELAPNPTSGGTQVHYAVARAGRVRVELLDVSGRVAATLADRDHEPGRYVAVWDGVGRRGRLAPGVYYLHLTAPDHIAMRKLAIVR